MPALDQQLRDAGSRCEHAPAMPAPARSLVKLWWIFHKDLTSECRGRRVWPAMLMFGVVVALVFSLQMDLTADQKPRIVGGLLWLAIFFAGMLAVDRALASEREEGCWEGLLLYPVSPSVVYLAKLAVNFVALSVLEAILIPLFVALSDVPLLAHPWAMLLVALLGNLGITAVGTFLSAVTNSVQKSGHMLGLLVLPMVIPVVLAAAEATRLMSQAELGDQWSRWVQLLAAFAVIFVTAGTVLFDLVIED